jgi:hypothetical protein
LLTLAPLAFVVLAFASIALVGMMFLGDIMRNYVR